MARERAGEKIYQPKRMNIVSLVTIRANFGRVIKNGRALTSPFIALACGVGERCDLINTLLRENRW